MEGAGRRVQRIEQRDHAQAVGANDDLWQGRRGRRQDRAAEGGCAQGPQGLEDRRQAETALDALPATWDEGPNAKVSSASIAEFIKGGFDAEQAFVGNQQGDVKQAIANAAKKVEAVYSYPYQNHATMEPMNATALYTADRCEAWVPTQVAEAALASVSEASSLPIAKCEA